MRQLADLVGISNPYLSQIERGLREPSEKVLDAIAQNLELSAEALHEHGGAGAPSGRTRTRAAGRGRDPGGPEADGAAAPGAAGGLQRVRRPARRRRSAALTVAAPERRDRRGRAIRLGDELARGAGVRLRDARA